MHVRDPASDALPKDLPSTRGLSKRCRQASGARLAPLDAGAALDLGELARPRGSERDRLLTTFLSWAACSHRAAAPQVDALRVPIGSVLLWRSSLLHAGKPQRR